jgi:hypothetical protein
MQPNALLAWAKFYYAKSGCYKPTLDEDINYNTSTSTPAAPCPAPSDAPSPQAPASSSSGPITQARARDLNFIMLLKNEVPEE